MAKDDFDWVHTHLGQVQNNLGNWATVLWLFTQAQIILVGLKLANVVDWDWWIISAPTWVPLLGLALRAARGLIFRLQQQGRSR